MYRYDTHDQTLVNERVAQFRDQMERYLAGRLSEEEFLPLRVQNGLYVQRHAPMLRIAIPYGMLASYQLRKLGDLARDYDRGYGHFTTRTNLQLNWPKLETVPDMLEELASVQMLLSTAEADGAYIVDASENLAFLTACLEKMTDTGEGATLDAGVKQLATQLITFPSQQERQCVSAVLMGFWPVLLTLAMLIVIIRRRRL